MRAGGHPVAWPGSAALRLRYLQDGGAQRVGHAAEQGSGALCAGDAAQPGRQAAAQRARLLLPDAHHIQRLPRRDAAGAANAACATRAGGRLVCGGGGGGGGGVGEGLLQAAPGRCLELIKYLR